MSIARVHAGRPLFVPDPDNPGWFYSLTTHDDEYLRLDAEWRRKIIAAHPDKGGTDPIACARLTRRFNRLRSTYDRWRASEAVFYGRLGQPLPERPNTSAVLDVFEALPAQIEYATAHKRGEMRRRAVVYLREHPDATSKQMAEALGVTRNYACRLQFRLRRPLTYCVKQRALATFLADRRPHTMRECAEAAQSSLSYTAKLLVRLRKRGLDIVARSKGPARSYQLLY